MHVELADEAWPIGPAPARDSYLNIKAIRRLLCLAFLSPQLVDATLQGRQPVSSPRRVSQKSICRWTGPSSTERISPACYHGLFAQPSISRDRMRVGIEAARSGRLLVSRIVAGNDRARALTGIG
jgi:hypothetical protein